VRRSRRPLPSAYSYHLRTLARYGFVEEELASAADSRQRPWRARIISFRVTEGADTTPAMRDAGRLLSESVHASAEELREGCGDREPEYPARWRSALGTSYDVLHATPRELMTLQRRLIGLFGEYRRLSRDERPPGARRVRARVGLIPWFEPDPAELAAAPPR
jgi:hypothetical protein